MPLCVPLILRVCFLYCGMKHAWDALYCGMTHAWDTGTAV